MTPELIHNIHSAFIEKFGVTPEIASAPGRINFIGGHTDYNDGFVLPAAIDKGIVTAIAKSTNDYCTVIALDKNESYQFKLNSLKPIKEGSWQNYIIGVVAELQKLGKTVQPFNVVFSGNIPDGAGLSSSAALENSMVLAIDKLFNLNLERLTMIGISQKAEHNYVGVKCGIMDQFASMFGQENNALFLDCRSLDTTPLKLNLDGYKLLLINTNVSHNLAEDAYNDRRNVCEKVANILGVKALRDAKKEDLDAVKSQISESDYQKVLYVIEEIERVQQAANAIRNNDLSRFGSLLFKAHAGAKNQYKISCDELDFLIDEALQHPHVIGARMMGGGFGGCTINIVADKGVEDFKASVNKRYKSRFNKSCTIEEITLSEGAHVIHKQTI